MSKRTTKEIEDVAIDSKRPKETDPSENTGLASVMADILGTNIKAPSAPILSKAKGTERKVDEAIKAEETENTKKIKTDVSHVIPTALMQDYERGLQKIATRGVIALFNAVKKQQNDLDDALARNPKSRARKVTNEVMDKGAFFDKLKKTDIGTSSETKDANPDESKTSKPGWLDDKYMMKAKLKDWGKENPDAEDSDEEIPDIDDEDDSDE